MRTISINTTQNVAIDYELAGLMERLLAFLLDTAITIVYAVIVYSLLLASTFALKGDDDMMVFFYSLLIFPVFTGYHLACESLWNGQSIGKKALGIKVVKCDGAQLTISDYAKRWMFRLVDIGVTAGSVGVLSIMSNDRSQRVGDIVADTCVIKTTPRNRLGIKDILKIKTQENYEPKYEGVVRFTEEDMLLLKNTLDRAKRNPNEHYKNLLIELTQKICAELDIQPPKQQTKFLKTILNDYIVLTR